MTYPRRRTRAGRVALFAAGLAVLTALAAPQATRADERSSPGRDDLRRQVDAQLRALGPAYAKAVEFEIEGDAVRLEGELGTARKRAWAAEAVKELDWVRRVRNGVRVVATATGGPGGLTPEAMERRLEKRFGLDPDQLGLVASGGEVRVDGLVESEEVARAITETLENDFGVERISNAVTEVRELPAGYGTEGQTAQRMVEPTGLVPSSR